MQNRARARGGAGPARAAGVLLLVFAVSGCGPSDPGERVFRRHCVQCHGDDGKGKTKFAAGRPYADLTDDLWKNGGDLPSIRESIAEGQPQARMPAFKERLSAAELDAVARYVLVLQAEVRVTPPKP